eukprot:6521916-Prymnesium_polylepis.1
MPDQVVGLLRLTPTFMNAVRSERHTRTRRKPHRMPEHQSRRGVCAAVWVRVWVCCISPARAWEGAACAAPSTRAAADVCGTHLPPHSKGGY